MDDLEGVLDNSDGLEFFAVVSSVHHEGVGESLNDGALSLAESLSVEASSGVRLEHLELGPLVHCDIVSQADVFDGNVIEAPLVEQLDFSGHYGRERKEIPQGSMPHRRETHQLPHDARTKQRQKTQGRPNYQALPRNYPSSDGREPSSNCSESY